MLAIKAKLTKIDAALVNAIGRRADVRRSTSGSLTFSEYGNQNASATAVPSSRMLCSLPNPSCRP